VGNMREPDNLSGDVAVTLSDVSVRERARCKRLVRDLSIGVSLLGESHPTVRMLAAVLSPQRQDPVALIWAPLGFSWWQRAGEAIGASAQQIRFAAACEAGLGFADAARVSGMPSEGAKARRNGYSASLQARVQKLRGMAQEERARRGL
jgi:hypothetical protein